LKRNGRPRYAGLFFMGDGKPAAFGKRRKSRRWRSSDFFVALPAGFFFGWAAPKKNQKNAAF
jgi:hypothetical protein